MFWKRGVKFALTSMTAALSACVVLVPCFLAIVGREGASSLTEDIPLASLVILQICSRAFSGDMI